MAHTSAYAHDHLPCHTRTEGRCMHISRQQCHRTNALKVRCLVAQLCLQRAGSGRQGRNHNLRVGLARLNEPAAAANGTIPCRLTCPGQRAVALSKHCPLSSKCNILARYSTARHITRTEGLDSSPPFPPPRAALLQIIWSQCTRAGVTYLCKGK